MNQTIERTTLSNLVSNEEYCRKVLPFIKPDYFDVKEERVVFEEITNFVDKYKRIPTKISLEIEVESRKDLTEDQRAAINSKKATYAKSLYANTDIGENLNTFNWPYDYCSLIEAVKINSKVGFRPDLDKEYAEIEENYLPPEVKKLLMIRRTKNNSVGGYLEYGPFF